MKILIGQNHLDTIGGSETYTYTLIEELKRRRFKVELACGSNRFGIMSKKIYQNFGIFPNSFDKDPDVCFINHISTIRKILDSNIDSKTIFQICHGTVPDLEQPFGKPIEKYITISEEVSTHVSNKGYNSDIVVNGINTNRFSPTSVNKEVKNILSLSQSDRFNNFLSKICLKNGWTFKSHNKFKNPIFQIENLIKEADMVISLGRGAYEAMSCGKNVLVADCRPYQPPLMDGLIAPDNIDEMIKHNCSGRRFKRQVNEQTITEEIKKFDHKFCELNRNYALENLNIEVQTEKMLNLIRK